MVIQHNIPSLYALRNKQINSTQATKNLEKLSSGFKINRAADNAAGLGISEKMRSQIREAKMCQTNVKLGIDIANTADGALEEISAMMVRARELCIAASNGTYTDNDRLHIEKEVQAIFNEVNRITEATTHNGIKVLREENTSTEGLPIIGYEYNESVTGTQGIIEWGLSSVVQSPSQIFDLAEPATKASVTFALDPSINVNDAKTLHGKSITVNGTRYNFTTDANMVFSSGYTYTISPTSNQTVEQYLKTWINNNDSYDSQGTYISPSYRPAQNFSDVSVNSATGEITFQAPLTTLNYTANGFNYSMADGNGAYYNNRAIYSDKLGNLRQVNGDVGAYNKSSDFVFAATATGSFTFTLKNTYSADDIDNLIANTLYINGNAVSFSRNGASGTYQVSDNMTRTQMETLLKTIFTDKGVTVDSTDSSGSNFTINGTVNAPSGWSTLSVYESPSYTPQDVSIPGITGFSAKKIQSSSSESAEIWEIEIPDNPTVPGGFSICGYSVFLYDSSNNPAGYSLYSPSASSLIDVNGLSSDQIKAQIMNRIAARVSSAFGSNNVSVTSNGNKATLTFKNANVSNNVTAGSNSGTLSFRKYASNELRSNSNNTYFSRDVSLPMQLAVDGNGDLDIAKLIGTGFTYQGYIFEFYNGGTDINTSATNIDISGCVTLDDVAGVMQTAISTRLGSTVTVTPGSNGQVTLKMSRPASTSYANTYITGNWQYDGMIASEGSTRTTKYFSGGTDAGKPGTSVDFSSINASNLDELLGTGFRIACASCANEFVNVLFRWDNDIDSVPPSFTLPPPNDNVTINNFVVELSKVSDPAQIVQNIVSQLTPVMQHFSGVRVDPNNPAVLIIEDKRYGDLPNNQRGSLIPGLFTNFTYGVTKEPIYGTVSGEVEFRDIPIYVSSVGQHEIPLHLPNMSLATLNLYPPRLSIKSVDEANEWLGRVDKAATSVAKVRGVIGSDQNRLEEAYKLLTNMEEQTTAAESTIRDADMAKEMMAFTKNNIIMQAAQAMVAQANQLPQGVLGLLH